MPTGIPMHVPRANGVWAEQPELIGPDCTPTLISVDLKIPLTALYRTTALLPPAA